MDKAVDVMLVQEMLAVNVQYRASANSIIAKCSACEKEVEYSTEAEGFSSWIKFPLAHIIECGSPISAGVQLNEG